MFLKNLNMVYSEKISKRFADRDVVFEPHPYFVEKLILYLACNNLQEIIHYIQEKEITGVKKRLSMILYKGKI